MQVETFKIFCDLVETASFSKAASINSITQSAVSQQISTLETRFKVKLIDRGRRNFSLTPEGIAFLEASKEILDIYESLGDRLHELQNVVAGDLRIAVIFSIGLHELPPYLKEFRRVHSDVEVQIEYRRSPQVYAQVLAGEVDLGLVAYPSKRKGLQVEPFIKDKLVVICHPAHRLASRKSVRLPDLKGEKFVSFEPDVPTRKVIDRHLRHQGVEVIRTIDFDNIETVKRAVEIENGISIVPQNTVDAEVRAGSLVALEITEPELWRPLGILLKRNRPRSPALKEFIGLLQRAAAGHPVIPPSIPFHRTDAPA